MARFRRNDRSCMQIVNAAIDVSNRRNLLPSAHSFAGYGFAIPRRVSPGVCLSFRPKRAWGMPGAQCTRSLVCESGSWNAHEYSQRGHRNHPASPRNGLRLMTRSPRRSGFVCHRRRRIGRAPPGRALRASADLTPTMRRQDHTFLPSAEHTIRQGRLRVHCIPLPRS
jgi:hypothetical protein